MIRWMKRSTEAHLRALEAAPSEQGAHEEALEALLRATRAVEEAEERRRRTAELAARLEHELAENHFSARMRLAFHGPRSDS